MVYTIHEQTLTNIADAIREKTGDTEPIQVSNFADKIGEIETGGGVTEPYIEETYDDDGDLVAVKMVGYTKVREEIYKGCKSLERIELPDEVTSIEKSALRDCPLSSLTKLPAKLTSVGDYAFMGSQAPLTELPAGITSIGVDAFYEDKKLTLVELPAGITRIRASAFYNCTALALTKLPARITDIGNSGFYSCYKLAITEIPATVTYIDSNAFYKCSGLKSIIFKGTPSRSIASDAFSYCANLTTINVPWAEGEVAYAPWGATNATINYNYTEDAE